MTIILTNHERAGFVEGFMFNANTILFLEFEMPNDNLPKNIASWEKRGDAIIDIRDLDEPDEDGAEVERDMDESMDGDHDSAMASAGFGTDEDYGVFNEYDGGDYPSGDCGSPMADE